MSPLDPLLVRDLAPRALGVLVRRGCGFAAAEDAVQEAVIEASVRWPGDGVPRDPLAWLVTVAHRRHLDAVRSDAARHRRERAALDEPVPGPTEQADDTLQLLFLCCHPSLSPSSAVALTLRAVGGLTTREIAEAFLVPEATMAQRISRAKRTLGDARFDRPGDPAAVLRVLYLVFTAGYAGRVDLVAEAIRLTRQLRTGVRDPEVDGLLALMLLHHARAAARLNRHGDLVPLDRQDRSRWDTAEIAEGVAVLQAALARGRHGEYQVQAAIAALHDDAATAAETDWPQILAWYDELIALRPDNPVVALNRAVAVGEVDGPLVALRELDAVAGRLRGHHRLAAVRAHLTERAGDRVAAARLYAQAAAGATTVAERDHLTRQAARLGQD
ncbi:RNA polymerase sigma factor [Nakamurella endophytica]|uniref:RNA polymerase sigma factor n=1 Tax=Nakamurella endophytica TaxID=1748367 RepID=A0A917SQ53_9ACTN|nr:sigma-70 family RNA polymerase sigma factor [Nakamurella endophytica]GGL92503.1 RNA polymerase sigma factor [Nakamurella endophytica]